MSILGSTNFVKKVCKILFLGKTSKLRDIVKTNIDNACDACGAQGFEELGCRLFRKSNCVEPHRSASSSVGVLSITWAMRASWRS